MTTSLRTAGFALALAAAPALAQTGKICIDPGHGGSDPGAVGNGQQEATNVLNTSLKLKSWLDKDTADGAGGGSWNVVMTRTTNVDVSLQGRCDISNNNSCNRFLSIHNNAATAAALGTETYCWSSGSATSYNLRDKVHARVIQAWGRVDRGVKTAGFYVIVNTNAPAELAEPAFITNAGDSAFTGSSTQQDTLAKYHLFALQDNYGIAAYTPLTAQTYVVDNSNTGFAASTNWASSTSTPGWYGSDYRVRTTQAISDTANWTINIPTAGNYAISAWWTSGANRAASAPYIMPDSSVVNVNQQVNGGSWQALAIKSLATGSNTVKLSCYTTGGFYVVADAVRMVGPQ